jgi:hypothetical protein
MTKMRNQKHLFAIGGPPIIIKPLTIIFDGKLVSRWTQEKHIISSPLLSCLSSFGLWRSSERLVYLINME